MREMEPRSRFAAPGAESLPIHAVTIGDEAFTTRLPAAIAAWARGAGWTPEADTPLAVRGDGGELQALLQPVAARPWPESDAAFPFAALPPLLGGRIPAGREAPPAWRIEGLEGACERRMAALGWLLGSSRRPHTPDMEPPLLVCPDGVDAAAVLAMADGVHLARRLVSAPANRLGPAALAAALRDLAEEHGGEYSCVEDSARLERDWPLLHLVGRAAGEGPRLAELRWGDPAHPAVTVVGKGVVFDSGGINLKPDSAMRLMRKDMGGAAAAMALAHMVMAGRLPVRLRVLLPIAENAVSAHAFRPGDVCRSRAGLSVEIGHTDAEGRLLLADALHAAAEEGPDLLLDFATLTGAARVALGPEMAALFTDDDALAAELVAAGLAERDPLWRLPLWPPYQRRLATEFADVSSTGSQPGAGAITAALFLRRFVPAGIAWAHVDLYAWNAAAAPGKPVGGECQAARACLAVLEARYRRR